MSAFFLLPFAAATVCLVVAFAGLLRRRPSAATWFFFAGMLTLAADAVLTGIGIRLVTVENLVSFLAARFVIGAAVPAPWLAFSLTYSRGNARESLRHWRIPLALTAAMPIVLALLFREELIRMVPAELAETLRLQFGPVATVVNVALLVSFALVLMNVEQTFRSAVGTMRWRIKFVVLGLAIIFGARLYVVSQALLFSSPGLSQWGIETGGLLVGCLFLAVAYGRTGLAEIDVYPSLPVLRSSLTLLFVGGYLFIVGVLAQFVQKFGRAERFQLQAFVVLVGMAGLAALLLSDRARKRLNVFVASHFGRAQHDSVQVWTAFSRRLASMKDESELAQASARLISETFDVLSVTVWLIDDRGQLASAASTAPNARPQNDPVNRGDAPMATVVASLRERSTPFDLEEITASWAEQWRAVNPTSFPNGGNRWTVPLRAGDRMLGAVVLADRVSGALYTLEEVQLLQCVADQMTSVLLNLRLAREVAGARELEALNTMSAFFVHDLKNAAASLNLMLRNLPVHFDDPEFRADALRAIGNSTGRIEDMIARLSSFRQPRAPLHVSIDLNTVVCEALEALSPSDDVELTKDLGVLPRIAADRDQLRSVVTNLVFNARDALERGGAIRISTEQQNGQVVLSVSDNGIGMSAAFVKEQLFRPFQSTKKKGLGIGLFQCRAIIQAHGGGIHAESELGRGTTFVVTLPMIPEP